MPKILGLLLSGKMKCPYCGYEKSGVVDKRASNEESTWRRRECLKCSKRFTTYERIEMLPLMVVKKDGRLERFDRNKVKNGILKACEKRPITLDKIDRVVDEIEARLRNKQSLEVKSSEIGELVMRKLKSLDKVAYIRFASVYKEFTDVRMFEEELKVMKGGG
jgi:transcriptional repressor NrdR